VSAAWSVVPPGCCTPVPRRLLAPARQQLLLPAGPPRVEERPRRLEQPRRVDVRLRRDPPDECIPGLGGEQAFEAGSRLLRAGEHDPNVPEPAHAAIERVGHVPQMPVDDGLDVPLVAALRPAALVVATGDVRRLVRQRNQLARAQPVDVAALAPDVGDKRSVVPSDETNERRQIELLRDASFVLHRPRQWELQEEVVALRGEHGDATNTLTAELAAEPLVDPLDVARESLPLLG
jgi:hypothetical protein